MILEVQVKELGKCLSSCLVRQSEQNSPMGLMLLLLSSRKRLMVRSNQRILPLHNILKQLVQHKPKLPTKATSPTFPVPISERESQKIFLIKRNYICNIHPVQVLTSDVPFPLCFQFHYISMANLCAFHKCFPLFNEYINALSCW